MKVLAAIRQLNPDRGFVGGFAPHQVSAVEEQQFYQAAEKSCAASGACSIGDHDVDLVELAVFTAEKLERMGVSKGKSGFWVGLEVNNERLWQAIESQRITLFELDFDAATGIQIDFPEIFKNQKELEMSADNLVCKCSTAVREGKLGDLKKADFEKALETLAKEYANSHNVDYHIAYAQVVKTQEGDELYNGYLASSQ